MYLLYAMMFCFSVLNAAQNRSDQLELQTVVIGALPEEVQGDEWTLSPYSQHVATKTVQRQPEDLLKCTEDDYDVSPEEEEKSAPQRNRYVRYVLIRGKWYPYSSDAPLDTPSPSPPQTPSQASTQLSNVLSGANPATPEQLEPPAKARRIEEEEEEERDPDYAPSRTSKGKRKANRTGDKTCNKCKQTGFSPSGLRYHKSAVHGQPGISWQCTHCPLSYPASSSLLLHLKNIHPKQRSKEPLQCSYGCGQQKIHWLPVLDHHEKYKCRNRPV